MLIRKTFAPDRISPDIKHRKREERGGYLKERQKDRETGERERRKNER